MFKKQPLNKGLETQDKKKYPGLYYLYSDIQFNQYVYLNRKRERERDTWNAVMTLKPKQLFS